MNHPTNTITLAAALMRAFPTPGPQIAEVNAFLLLEDGILEVPVYVQDGERRIPVFLFTEANESAGRQFAWAFQLMKKLGSPHVVYYAPTPLQSGPPLPNYRDFYWNLFQQSKATPQGDYFSWWTTPKESDWTDSRVQKAMQSAFQSMDGYESIFFGALLYWIDVTEEQKRIRLPDEPYEVYLEAPEGQRVFLSASQEKGLRFHFDPDTTTDMYRDRFWTHFAAFCQKERSELESQKIPPDPTGTRPRDWFAFMDEQLVRNEREKGHPVQKVCGIMLR